MEILDFTVADIPRVLPLYVAYYNEKEGGCWTAEKADTRIRQVVTMQGARGFLLCERGRAIGFVMGYFKQYDDLVSYQLEEIVIAAEEQGKGYGRALLAHTQQTVLREGASCVELISINDAFHLAFYGKAGFHKASNHQPMSFFPKEEP